MGPRTERAEYRGCIGVAALVMAAMTISAAPNNNAAGSGARAATVSAGYCSQTAELLAGACEHERQDDYLRAAAVCTNESDTGDRADCFAEAEAARGEAGQLCDEQAEGRMDACQALGEDRYDPEFEPGDFEKDYKKLATTNAYFPLGVGNRWEYRGGVEVNTVEVLPRTKLVDEVPCVVLRDRVWKDGDLVEDTDDWFAQARDGSVWYCGEEVKDFESFKGDAPRLPELISIDGSFKAGRDGDKPGIIFLASPRAGEVYQEEFSLGHAEDMTEVLSITYGVGHDRDLDRFVPRQLVRRLCANDCVVTRNTSKLEPGTFALKYFAPGIGFFLEVQPEGHEVLQLVNCNFDPRCTSLPTVGSRTF